MKRLTALLAFGLGILLSPLLTVPVSTQAGFLYDTAGRITVTGSGGLFDVTVSGSALTSLQLLDNLVSVEDNPAGSAFSGIGMLAVRQDAFSALAADGDFYPPTIDGANGGLKVSIVAGAGSGGTAIADGAVFTINTTSFTPIGGIYQSATTDITDGDGAVARLSIKGAMKVALTDGVTGAYLTPSTDVTEDAAETAGGTGPMVMNVRRDTLASSSATSGDNSTFNSNVVGALWTAPTPSTNGGLAIHRSLDLDEGAGEVVKSAAGQVYAMWVTNTATATRYIKFYNATSCTMGTGTPVITVGIPGNTSDDVAGSFGPGGMGIAFGTGICVGATTGVADADTGAPGANDVQVNVFYK